VDLLASIEPPELEVPITILPSAAVNRSARIVHHDVSVDRCRDPPAARRSQPAAR
jgi:hypothetical protein